MDRISASQFLDPTFGLLLLLALALLHASRRWRTVIGPTRARRGLWPAWVVWAAMWLFATPWFSSGLLGRMEMPPVDVAAALGDTPEDRCAMIVLSGGNRSPQPGTWRSERLVASSLPRAIGAARVYHDRPVGHVIVSGRGAPPGQPDETAAAMADVMVAHGVPRERIVIEPMALNTRQNAEFSAKIVRDLGAEKTVVVTSALHMKRSVLELERAGLRVIAAPVDHRHDPTGGLDRFIPSTASLVVMYQVLHEIFGRFKP